MLGGAGAEAVIERGDGATAPALVRRLIFVSHASPQDSIFATWLATQLAIAGYEVWCDTTKLLGGERFWSEITEVIDSYASQFLFVSTLEANRKRGTLRELRLALAAQKTHRLKDFIVPLKIDAFPFQSMQKPLPDLNAIRFDENWAAGLAQLLKLLEREGVPKSPHAGPACVTEWYRRALDRRRQILMADEKCHSNWFRLRLPKHLLVHAFNRPSDALMKRAAGFPYPYRVHSTHLVTFASSHQVAEHFGLDAGVGKVETLDTDSFVADGDAGLDIASLDASNIMSDLVRQAWETTLTRRSLASHTLASGLAARFFTNGQLQKNRAYFRALGGRRTYRQVVGNKSKRTPDGKKVPDGFWHYALSASPQLVPFPRLVLRHHVIFTDDGATPWPKSERMHKARRSVCKQWWNREWRDRLFAFATELSKGRKQIALDVGGEQRIKVTMVPMNFIAPWTYLEDADDGLDEYTDIELVEDEEAEDDDTTP